MTAPQLVEEAVAPEEFTDEEKAKQLPDPCGYHILCALPEFDVKFDGSSLIRPDKIIDQERLATVVLFVLKLGPDCYRDKERYPYGPWCRKGDFVLTRQYTGTRLRIYGKEFRLVKDDQIEAVVQDPRGISRV
jgi:co-chaperonin GroES (HSP10)